MSEFLPEAMEAAFLEAKRAFRENEVPIGAAIVHNGKIIAKAHNKKERKKLAIAHAEILAIKKANKKLKNWRCEDCDIYITLAPCKMCQGAINNARFRNVYVAAESTENVPEIEYEIKQEYKKQSLKLLKSFFEKFRDNS